MSRHVVGLGQQKDIICADRFPLGLELRRGQCPPRAREVEDDGHPVVCAPVPKAFEDGGNWLNYVRLDPALRAGLRNHPRFAALLQRLAETGNTPA